MSDFQKMTATVLAAGLSVAMPVRPLGRKTSADIEVTYHKLSRRSWICAIKQYGRTKTGKGSTKTAAYVAAFHAK